MISLLYPHHINVKLSLAAVRCLICFVFVYTIMANNNLSACISDFIINLRRFSDKVAIKYYTSSTDFDSYSYKDIIENATKLSAIFPAAEPTPTLSPTPVKYLVVISVAAADDHSPSIIPTIVG